MDEPIQSSDSDPPMETSSSVRLPIPSSESTGSTGSLSPEAHLSTVVTLLMALVLVGGMGFFIWLQVSIPRVDRVGFPERALSHLVSRTLDMEEAIAQAPVWERSLYQLTADNGSSDLR